MIEAATGWRRRALMAWCSAALAVALLASTAPASQAQALPPSRRVALVIGQGDYRNVPRPAALDDAGLVAQVLAGAGFDVTGARDLDGDGMRRAFRDFLDKAGAMGPDGIAVVYLAGQAIQEDGDNFIVPVDARMARASDIPIEAVRLADLTHALASLPIQAKVVIVDGAYAGASGTGSPATGDPASGAPGLALVEAEQGELLAFNAAPGTVAPATSGAYGVYAQALAEAIKQGGVPVGEVFDRVRLAVNQATGGGVVPWESNQLTRGFTFFERASGAPAAASAQIPFAALEKRPLRDFPPDQAYDVAVARDTLPSYVEFLATFPDSPLARRIRLFQAVRREALFWRAALQGNTPAAFWTYLARYPKGPHAGDARHRLTRLAAAAAPPRHFLPLGFDVPPAPPGDVVVDRPLGFDVPDLPPPSPPPTFLLPPPTAIVLERPLPPPGRALLPVPVPVAIPFVRAPVDPGVIAPPSGVKGEYAHPRPFARGPNGDGLVVLAAPPAPQSNPPAVSRLPAIRILPALPPPQSGADARPAPLPQPVPPTVHPASVPVSPEPQMPKAAAAPAGRPLSMPAMPVAPTPPRVPMSPVPPPALVPEGRPVQGAPHKATPPPVAPLATPVLPATSPRSTAPPPVAARAGPAQMAPAPRPVAPKPVAPLAQRSPARPAAEARPASARPPAPDRKVAQPAAPDRHAPETASGPSSAGGRHPACGHPGEPHCRP